MLHYTDLMSQIFVIFSPLIASSWLKICIDIIVHDAALAAT